MTKNTNKSNEILDLEANYAKASARHKETLATAAHRMAELRAARDRATSAREESGFASVLREVAYNNLKAGRVAAQKMHTNLKNAKKLAREAAKVAYAAAFAAASLND